MVEEASRGSNGSPKPASLKEETPIRQYNLIGIHGPYIGKRFRLPSGATRIGRSAEYNDIVLDRDSTVSRRHATIQLVGNRLTITDEGSLKGTYVNNKELRQAEAPLTNGDEVWIGKSIFRVVPPKKWDFSPPRKTGFRYVRLAWPALAALVIVVTALCAQRIIVTARYIADVTARPGALEFSGGGAEHDVSFYPPPAASDLDGDGYLDYVLATGPRVEAISGKDGFPLWPIKGEVGGSVTGAPVVGDVTGDGSPDVVVAWYDNLARSGVSAFEGLSGGRIANRPLGGEPSGPPALGDPEADGFPDILVAAHTPGTVPGERDVLFARYWNSNGLQVEWTEATYSGGGPGGGIPLLVDVDDDGRDEVLLPSGSIELLILSWESHQPSTATPRPRVNLASLLDYAGLTWAAEAKGPVAVADLDGDGSVEIITLARQNIVVVARGPDFQRPVWVANLGVRGMLPTRTAGPVVTHIDLDGVPDVVVGLSDGRVYAFSGSQPDVRADDNWLWEWTCEDGGIVGDLATVDLNKDGTGEIVLLSEKGTLFVLAPEPAAAERVLWKGSGFGSPPVVCDFDGDHKLEFASRAGSSGELLLVDTNVRCPRGQILWQQPQGDSAHTGRILPWPAVDRSYHVVWATIGVWVVVVGAVVGAYLRRRAKVSV